MIYPLGKYMENARRGKLRPAMEALYGPAAHELQAQRFQNVLNRLERLSNSTHAVLVNAPGRTELGGNHTDHNNGVVLAAAVQFDCLAAAAPVSGDTIRIRSEGFPETIELSFKELDPRPEEEGTPTALVRGVLAGFANRGYDVGGFDACIAGDVPMGAGLSSSAAFEICIGRICNHLFNDGLVDPVTLALIGQTAENVHFGKPCGLMDQLACSKQGILSIDFENQAAPAIREIDFSFNDAGYQLVVVDTGGNHADLTPDYAAIPVEMRRAAQVLGQDVARGLTMEQVMAAAPEIREQAGDRALLRLIHFLEESDRALGQAEALRTKDMDRFLSLVRESGDSSWRLLQNCISPSDFMEQRIPVGLTLTERFLHGQGAWRIQGGGFAGSFQAYVPLDRTEGYRTYMEQIFGSGSVVPLHIRKPGFECISPDGQCGQEV